MGWGHVPGGGRGGEESACVRWPCVGGWGMEVGRMSVMQELPARSGRGVLSAARVVRRVLLGLPPRARWHLRAQARTTA